MATVHRWRGVTVEDADAVTGRISSLLRARSRRLLGSLLAPNGRSVIWLTVAVVTANVAAIIGPWLVELGIDRQIPAIAARRPSVLYLIVGVILAAALVHAVLSACSCSGRDGWVRRSCSIFRQRMFSQFQRLSLSFHERYTSGRMISRLTSDLDATTELLNEGLDTLVTSILSTGTIAVILVLLDLPTALVTLSAFVPLLLLTQWFQRRPRLPTGAFARQSRYW